MVAGKTAKLRDCAILVFALLALTAVACPAASLAADAIGADIDTSHQVLEIPPASLPDGGWQLLRDVTTATGRLPTDNREAKKSDAQGESTGAEAGANDQGTQSHQPDAGLSPDPSLAGIDDYMSQEDDGFPVAAGPSALALFIPPLLLGAGPRNRARFWIPPDLFLGAPHPLAPSIYDPNRRPGPPWLGGSPYGSPFMPPAGYWRR